MAEIMDGTLEADETRPGRNNHPLDHFRKSNGLLDGAMWCPAARKGSTNPNSHQDNAESSESLGRGIPLPASKAPAAELNSCGDGVENREDFGRDMAQPTWEGTVKCNFEDSVISSVVVSSDTLCHKKEMLVTINCHQESIENSEELVCEKLGPKAETSRRLNQGCEKCSEYLDYEKLCSKTATSARINCYQDCAKLGGGECYKKELSAKLNCQQFACERSGCSCGLSQMINKLNLFPTAANNTKKTSETPNSDYDIRSECQKDLHVLQSRHTQNLIIHQNSSVRDQENVYLEKDSSLDIKEVLVNFELSPNICYRLNSFEELNTNLQHIPEGDTSLLHCLSEHQLELRIPSDIGYQNSF